MSSLTALWVALIVAVISSVIGPSLAALLAGHQRRQEKKEEWDRQDKVEERTNAKLKTTEAKIDGIRVLVDGGYTNNLKRTLAALRAQHIQMKRLYLIAEKAGDVLTKDDIDVQEALEAEIASVEEEIKDRVKQAEEASKATEASV